MIPQVLSYESFVYQHIQELAIDRVDQQSQTTANSLIFTAIDHILGQQGPLFTPSLLEAILISVKNKDATYFD